MPMNCTRCDDETQNVKQIQRHSYNPNVPERVLTNEDVDFIDDETEFFGDVTVRSVAICEECLKEMSE